ncbi:Cardiomyopathy-associated protein [Actinidia chinensis var. chinensis]|uniref:Cardiomyopathy-associated protein n=1 Tax=Actinidia chinensis var. chinensis TaxID=1590841 RepID=A0A2R6QHH5_ACTCC|nr:Cardiomyopathy-associated protein [Actinidia chinensis var. chinensis]
MDGYTSRQGRRTLLRGYPNNVKGWKRKFFFASGDYCEFLEGLSQVQMSQDHGVLYQVVRAQARTLNQSPGKTQDCPSSLDWMRISLTKLAKKVGEKKGKKADKSKGMCSAMMPALPTKGIIIREKRQRDEVLKFSPKKVSSKGKEAMPILEPKKAKSTPNEAAIVAARLMAPGEGTSVNPVAALSLELPSWLARIARGRDDSIPEFRRQAQGADGQAKNSKLAICQGVGQGEGGAGALTSARGNLLTTGIDLDAMDMDRDLIMKAEAEAEAEEKEE